MNEVTEAEIDAGARALRERQMAGRITRPWGDVPKGEQKKWREHARAVLFAASAAGNMCDAYTFADIQRDAKEFCDGAFGPFGVDTEPYAKFITELLQHAVRRATE